MPVLKTIFRKLEYLKFRVALPGVPWRYCIA